MAPSYTYPQAHDDCYDVIKYIFTNTEELDIDGNNIILCGDSAGGNLVTTLVIKLCEENTLKYTAKALVSITIFSAIDRLRCYFANSQ